MARGLELGRRKEKRIKTLINKVDAMFDNNIKMVGLVQELLKTNNNELALKIIDLEEISDQLQQEIVIDVNTIIITEQPKAGDLRLVLSILIISNELEIISDYYKKFAKKMLKTELSERKHQELVSSLVATSYSDLNETKEAFDKLSHDLASSIARRSEEVDEIITTFTNDINNLLVEAGSYDEVKSLTRILSMSKNLERTFAHLLVICEQISYIANGQVFHYA